MFNATLNHNLILSEHRCNERGGELCSDGVTCISTAAVCDGVTHCPDYSDEFDCGRGLLFSMYY